MTQETTSAPPLSPQVAAVRRLFEANFSAHMAEHADQDVVAVYKAYLSLADSLTLGAPQNAELTVALRHLLDSRDLLYTALLACLACGGYRTPGTSVLVKQIGSLAGAPRRGATLVVDDLDSLESFCETLSFSAMADATNLLSGMGGPTIKPSSSIDATKLLSDGVDKLVGTAIVLHNISRGAGAAAAELRLFRRAIIRCRDVARAEEARATDSSQN